LGLFEKYLPLRLNLRASHSFNGLLADLRDTLAEHDRWHLSYMEDHEQSAALTAPSFQWDDEVWSRDAADVRFVEEHIEIAPRCVPLDLSCRRIGKSIDLTLTFDTAACAVDEARRMMERLETILRQVSDHRAVPLQAIDGLSEQERLALLELAKGPRVT